MIFSGANGFKKRSISDQIDTFGYDLTVNVDNNAGSCQVGFSGDNALAAFTFSEGKITDPAGKFVQSYNYNTDVHINGIVRQDSYDYFINGEPIALGYPWHSGRYSWFFVNPHNVNADVDIDLSGVSPTYDTSGSGFYTASGSSVTGFIVNQTPDMRFRIFGAEVDELGSPYYVQSFESGYISGSGEIVVSSHNATNSTVTIPIVLYTNFGEVDFDFFVGGNNVTSTPNPQNIYLTVSPFAQIITSNKGLQQYTVSFSNFPSGAQLDISMEYASGVTGLVYRKTAVTNMVSDQEVSGMISGAGALSRFISHNVTGYDPIGHDVLTSGGSGNIVSNTLYATGEVFLPYNLQVTGFGQGTTYQNVLATGEATVEVTGRANFLGTFVNVVTHNVPGVGYDPVFVNGVMPTASGGVTLLPTGTIPVVLDPSDYYVGYLASNVCWEGDLFLPYSVLGVGYATGRHIVDKVRANFNSCFEPGHYKFEQYFSGQGTGEFASYTLFDPVKCTLDPQDITGLITGDFFWEGMLGCSTLTGDLPTITASGVPIAIYYKNGSLVSGNKSVFLMEPADGYSPYESSYLAEISGIYTRTQISHSGHSPSGTGFFDQVINTCGYAEGIWSETLPTYTYEFVCDSSTNGPNYFNGHFYLRSGSHENDFYNGTIDSGVLRFALTGGFTTANETHSIGIRMVPIDGQPVMNNPDFWVFRDGTLVEHWPGWTTSGTQTVMVNNMTHYYTYPKLDYVHQMELKSGNYEVVMRYNDNPFSKLPTPICDYAYFPCQENFYPEHSVAYVPIARGGDDITRPLTVNVSVVAGTARDGVDFQYTGSSITWAPGEIFEKMVEVSLTTNARFDPYHTIELSVPVPACYLGQDLSMFSSEITIQPDTCCCPKPDIVPVVPLQSENFYISGQGRWVAGGNAPEFTYVPIFTAPMVDSPYEVTGMKYFIDCTELTSEQMITPFSGQWPARDVSGNVLVGEHVLKAYAMTDCVGVGNPCAPYAQTLGGTLTGCLTSGFEEVPFYVYEQPCANYYDACDIDNRYTGSYKSDVNSAYGTYAMLPNQDFNFKWHTNAVRQRLKIYSYDSGCNETLLFDTKCAHIGELILASANQTNALDFPPFFAVNLSGELNEAGPYIPRHLYYHGTGIASGVPFSSYATTPIKAATPFPGVGWADGFDPSTWSQYQARLPVSGSDTAIVTGEYIAPTQFTIIGECNSTGSIFPGENVYFDRDFSISTFEQTYRGFNTAGSELWLNGNATINGQFLQLTQAVTGQDGSAFLSVPSSAIVSFNTTFSFALTNGNNGNGADGFAFVIQTYNKSIGGAGGGLGYAGISPSIAVEFDTFQNTNNGVGDPNDNHIGININGNLTSVATFTGLPARLNNGLAWNAEIDYDGAVLSVYCWPASASKPASPQLSYAVDIASLITSDERYVGFTASCGADYQIHEISQWDYKEYRRLTPFTDPSVGLTINNNAYIYGGATNSFIRLTEAQPNQGGQVYITLPSSAVVGFNSAFSFRMDPGANNPGAADSDGPGADGLAFILQTKANNAGGIGGGLGYEGIFPSVAIEFDTFQNTSNNDPNGNHVGININGRMISAVTYEENNARFNNGNIWYVWIDYDGATISVYYSQTNVKPSQAQLSYTVDVGQIIGTAARYVGFTASTGSGYETHDIIDWIYQETRIESDPYETMNSLNSNYFVEPLTLSCPPITYFLTTLSNTTYIRVEIGAKCNDDLEFPPAGPGPGGPGTGGPGTGGPGGGTGNSHDHGNEGETHDPTHDCTPGDEHCTQCPAGPNEPCTDLCVCDGCCLVAI